MANLHYRFWEEKNLEQMTEAQWEALCDGCGRCCLVKLEDEDSGEIYTTSVACRLLERESCKCCDYENRFASVPDCLDLRKEQLAELSWLPQTCAYRLIFEGKQLADWHPLIAGNDAKMQANGISISGQTVSEDNIEMEELGNYLHEWPIAAKNHE